MPENAVRITRHLFKAVPFVACNLVVGLLAAWSDNKKSCHSHALPAQRLLFRRLPPLRSRYLLPWWRATRRLALLSL